MFFEKRYASPKDIIMEAIRGKVSRIIYYRIQRTENLDDIEDLSDILSKKDFDLVSKCVREAFARQTIWYLAVFGIIMGNDTCDLDCQEFDVDL